MKNEVLNSTSVILAITFLIIGAGGMYLNTPEKIVTNTITEEVIVEVIKEVETIVEVELEQDAVLDDAIDELFDEIDDDRSLQKCKRHYYDMDEISVSRIYDDYSITYGDETIEYEFEVRLRYDEDDERSCSRNLDVSVLFEEDEKPEIDISS